MQFWKRCCVVIVAALMLHASLLAAMPLVWCIGAHGHNAVELCAGASCHHGPAHATGNAAKIALTANDAHSEPCLDGRVIEEQLAASQIEAAVAAPVLVPIPAPLVISNSTVVLYGAQLHCERRSSRHALLSHSRSPVVRI